LAPYVARILEVFGSERVLFGGDWPVVNEAGTYAQWVEAVSHLIASQPAAARHAIWLGNAQRYYQLNV
jgi:L-fuconolactonase